MLPRGWSLHSPPPDADSYFKVPSTPPLSYTRPMLRLTTRSSCLPEASTYSPRQVPDRSAWAAGVAAVSGAVAAGTAGASVAACAPVGFADGGATGAAAPEFAAAAAAGGAAASVEIGVGFAVDARVGAWRCAPSTSAATTNSVATIAITMTGRLARGGCARADRRGSDPTCIVPAEYSNAIVSLGLRVAANSALIEGE